MGQNKEVLSSRMRFMIQDIMDLRKNKWVDRRIKEVKQKKLSEIQRETNKDSNRSKVSSPKRRVAHLSPTKADGGWETVGSGKKKSTFVPRTSKRGGLTNSSSPVNSETNSRHHDKDSSSSNNSRGAGKANASNNNELPGVIQKPLALGGSTKFSLLGDEENEMEEESSKRRVGGGGADDTDGESPLSNGPKTPDTEIKDDDFNPPDQSESRGKRSQNSDRKKKTASEEGDFDEETITRKIKSLVSEYLTANDLQEATLCITELKNSKQHYEVVAESLKVILETTKDAEKPKIVTLLCELKANDTLSTKDFNKGLATVLADAEDASIDIPTFGKMLGNTCALILAKKEDTFTPEGIKGALQTVEEGSAKSQADDFRQELEKILTETLGGDHELVQSFK